MTPRAVAQPSPPPLAGPRPLATSAARLAWFQVGVWSLVIYGTIPLARTIERRVGARLGEASFIWIGLVAVFLAAAVGAARLVRSRRYHAVQFLWLAAVAALYLVLSRHLAAPVEALHFLEYGGLGLLAHRALRHPVADRWVYPAAALTCTLIGTGDELLQWVTPQRFWDFRDVGLNALSAALAQVAVWQGLRPAAIARRWTAGGFRVASGLAVALILLLALCSAVTPQRLAEWARLFPALAPLRDNPSVMAEYGHAITEPGIGRFASRLTRAELARQDATRAAAVAALLDLYPDAVYGRFEREQPSWRDPFLYEARVHLFRRDRYIESAARAAPGSPEQRQACTVAEGENAILERFFARTLAASGYGLAPAARGRCARPAPSGVPYESPIGRHLFTRWSEGGIRVAAAASILVLLVLRHPRRRRPGWPPAPAPAPRRRQGPAARGVEDP